MQKLQIENFAPLKFCFFVIISLNTLYVRKIDVFVLDQKLLIASKKLWPFLKSFYSIKRNKTWLDTWSILSLSGCRETLNEHSSVFTLGSGLLCNAFMYT